MLTLICWHMDILWAITLIMVLTIGLLLGILGYSFAQGDRPHKSRPATYLQSLQDDVKTKPVVLLAGDSLTHGNIGVAYFDIINEEYDQEVLTLVNAGINGDFAWNILQRVEEMIECKPDIVFILVGSNDALSQLPITCIWAAQRRKHLPERPTKGWFEESLRHLVRRFLDESSAQVVLMSIPPIGEDLRSNALQVSKTYSSAIKEISRELGVEYLPIHEEMVQYLRHHTPNPTYQLKNAIRGMVVAMVRHFVFGKSWDAIANDSEQVLHVDYIHLNSTGASIIADSVREYLHRYGY